MESFARHRFQPARWSAPGSAGSYIPRMLLVAAIVWLVWPAVTHAIEVWSVDEEFTYGFLIAPISALLVWWRRASLRSSLGKGDRGGLIVVVTSAAIYVTGERAGINAIAGLAVSPLLFGIAAYLWGWDAARVLAFPVGFLAFGLGLYRGLLDSVGFALQQVTAVGAAATSHLLGVVVVRDGLILRSNQFAFLVAEQCSGMSSLLSLLALAALWTYAARGSLPARVAVLLSVLPLVIIANTTRVTAVLLVASWFGSDAALGFFHGASSLVLFGLALSGLVLISRMVGCKTPQFAA